MKVKRKQNSNKQLIQMLQIMVLCGTLVVANVLFTMITKTHIWSGQSALNVNLSNSIVTTSVSAKRGTIYDRNYQTIAQEVTAYTIIAYLDESMVDADGNPNYVKDIDQTVKKLKTVLEDLNTKSVKSILKNAKKREAAQTELGPGTKRLDEETMKKIKKLDIPGIEFVETVNRNYPTTPFASSLIGFATFDEDQQKITGKMGLEMTLDEKLSGKDGFIQYQQASDGSVLPGTTQIHEEAVDGYDVVLTLDSNVQMTVEKAMQQTMEQNNASNAWCLVMEPSTGKVLAWASYPAYDQNKHDVIPSYVDGIREMQVEVGSVMKVFTYATAIDTGVYPSTGSFRAGTFTYTYDPNTSKITRVANGTETGIPPISDALGEDFGTISFDQGLALSSNVGICELLANYINYNDFSTYLDNFGFFQEVDSPYLQTSVTGVKNLGMPMDYLSTGFGQSSAVTILQLAQAYTAIFNDGIMMRPYVVDSIVDSTTNQVIEQYEPKAVGTPISSDTAKKMTELMRLVVADGGTASRYQMDGIDLIAKTGTGEIYNEATGDYSKDKYTSSIMAAAPGDDPQIMVFWGMQSTNYINFSEQPFKDVMQAALTANGVSKTVTEESQEETFEKWETYEMPSLTNHTLAYAQNRLDQKKVHVTIIGDGTHVVDQCPLENKSINSNDRVFILTDGNTITMPNMTGWTRKDITAFWQLTGISIQTSGYGKVVSQNIEEGQAISKDSNIEVSLE